MNDPVITRIETGLERFKRAVADADKWFRCRLTELIRLRDAAKSNTTKETMEGACNLTGLAYKVWESVCSDTTALMIAFAESYDRLSASERQRFEEETSKVHEAFADLTESLIYKTYKPDYKDFHRDTAKNLILSALKKIGFLSVLDDLEELREIDPRYKLPKRLKSGDEVLVYVEQYGEQVVEWHTPPRQSRPLRRNSKNS